MTSTPTRPTAGPLAWRRASLELLQAQLDGIEELHREARVAAALETRRLSREALLDARRRLDVVRRQQEVLVQRSAVQLRAGREMLDRAVPHVLVGHRQAWSADRLRRELEHRGLQVVALLDNAADVVATTAVEQPDVVVVEDRLPMLRGPETVAALRRVAPVTAVVAQTADPRDIGALLEAGATAVFSRQVPMDDLADAALSALLAGGEEPRPTASA